MSDVTYRIEEKKRKPGRRRQRRVVHFNYLKLCHSPPQETLSPSSQELSGQVRNTPVNSGEVELEWLGIPASPVTECQPDAHEDTSVLSPVSPVTKRQPDAREDTSVLIPASQDADVPDSSVTQIPHQPETPVESSSPVADPSQRPRCERREPAWLRDYVRTVVY